MPCKLGDSTAWGNTYLTGFDLAIGPPKGRLKRCREIFSQT